MKVLGQLESACIEQLSSDPSTSTQGRVWENTTLGKIKTDNGTDKRAVLKNDDKAAIGNSVTLSENIRFHRGGAGILQHIPESITTSEGTLATTLSQVSQRTENYTDAGKPAAGNAGRTIFLTDLEEIKTDNGASWVYPIKLDSIAPTTTKGDLIVRNASTNTRLPVGTDGQVLKANSTTGTGLEWASGTANAAVRSVTTTDTATSADDVLYLSGASFNETIFTAVGNDGKIIELVHDGISLVQAYTLLTVGGQTIGGIASGGYTLYTNGERLKLIASGGNWKILGHETDTDEIDLGTLYFSATSAYVFTVTAANATIGAVYSNNGFLYTVSTTITGGTTLNCSGTGTPSTSGTLTKVSGTGDATITFSSRTITGVPAKGTNSQDKIIGSRRGRFLTYTWRYAQSGAGTAGSGDYIYHHPSLVTHDATYVNPVLTVGTVNTQFTESALIGYGNWNDGATLNLNPICYSSTQFRMIQQALFTSVTMKGSGNGPISTATQGGSVTITIPVVGWRP